MNKSYVIIPFGGAGVGKSTLCNFLLDGKDSQSFISSDTTEGGETQDFKSLTGYALGDKVSKKYVKIFDTPGMADPQIPIALWVEKIKESILPTENIDMVLLVVKATDYRLDIAQIASMRVMKTFLDDLQPENTFVAFTHCDNSGVKGDFKQQKLASLLKYGKLTIPPENVIEFDNTVESLQDFVDNMVRGTITITEDIDEALENIDEGMSAIAKNVDDAHETNLTYQLKLLQELYADLQREREEEQQRYCPVYIYHRQEYDDGDDDDTYSTRVTDSSDLTADSQAKREPKRKMTKAEKDKALKEFESYDGLRKKDGFPDARTP